jgi:hypothetical protein
MQRQLTLFARRGLSAMTVIAGGLLVSSVASASAAQGVQVAASTAVVHVNALPRASGNVEVNVPVAAFGQADGAPKVLVGGRTYPIVITAWVAATSGPAVVNVVASSGRLIGTTHATVRAGVTRLHYVLVVPRESGPLTVAANTHTHDGGIVTAAYNHSTR